MSEYRNTLRTADQVLDVSTNRRGVVAAQPREKSVMISVIYDGTTTARPLYVGDLRYILDGKAEEDPPIEGTLPARPETAQPPRQPRQPAVKVKEASVVDNLKAKLESNTEHRAALQKRFLELGAENERIEQAIKVLTA